MVVAHPDDESIFGGDLLLSEPGWDVVCVTGTSKPKRQRELEAAMKIAGASSLICLDHIDSLTQPIDSDQLQQELETIIDETSYKRVVTHNPEGEYFHPQHRAVYTALSNLIPESLYVFHRSDAPLPPKRLQAKQTLLRAYPSQAGIIHSITNRYGLDFTQITGARCPNHIVYEGIIEHRMFCSQTRLVPLSERRPGLAAALLDDILRPLFPPERSLDDLLGEIYPHSPDLLKAMADTLSRASEGEEVLLAWSGEIASPSEIRALATSQGFRRSDNPILSQFGTLPKVHMPQGRRSPMLEIWTR